MNKKLKIQRHVLSFLLAAVLILVFFVNSFGYTERQATVSTTGTTLNVRAGAGTDQVKSGTVENGAAVTVVGEATAGDGMLWYKIRYQSGGQTAEGYVSSVYIRFTVPVALDNDFETYLNNQGFPESYKESLRQLHASYPNWVFKAQRTEMDWDDAVKNQAVLGKNLVPASSISSWKSIQPGAYDWSTSTWAGLDGSGWVAASEEIIKYYLDPRNFLTESSVFQFLVHSYNSSMQNEEGLRSMLGSTFLSGSIQENGTTIPYSSVLMTAAQQSQVNPYVLGAMIIQEQGTSGSGRSISGTESGYSGLYNYFNIEAYAGGGMTAVQRGLWYAGQTGSYNRPWNTRQGSIIGGAVYYGMNYVNSGQDTFYLKKFNVQGQNPHKHQYMTNVQGAAGEAAKLFQAYTADIRQLPLEFKIPVFNNMPQEKSPIPIGDGNPNNMLESLEVGRHSLTPSFDKNITEYNIIILKSEKSLSVTAKALHSSATVTGTGTVNINNQTKAITVSVKAQNGTVKNYTINVAYAAGSKGGDVSESTNNGNFSMKTDYQVTEDGFIKGVASSTKTEDFLQKIQITGGTAKVTHADGSAASDKVGTGDIVAVYNSGGSLQKEYKIVVPGDVNGDGVVNSLDLLKIQKHLLGASPLEGVYAQAADVNGNGKVDALDLLKVQKHILGAEKLGQ